MILEPFFREATSEKGAEGKWSGIKHCVDCIRRMQELYQSTSGQDVCFRIELPSSKNTKYC